MSKNIIIVAPHADDEIIGCWGLFARESVEAVYYGPTTPEREVEAKAFCQAFGVRYVLVSVDKLLNLLGPGQRGAVYFPDPVFETHPVHRMCGAIGERLLRAGRDVVFYSTNMVAPYIYEVPFSKEKKQVLEKYYPSQRNLWRFDHKYFLFEGYCRWLRP